MNCKPGIPGAGPGQFSNPTSIAVGTAAKGSKAVVYVGDQGNNLVEVFGANGKFQSSLDGSNTPEARFSQLIGVAVDQSNNLWTADGSTDNIDEFDASGKFLQQWTDPFGSTLAITVDSVNGFVYLIRGSQETESFSLTGANETVVDNGVGVALAIDPSSGNLYVDHGGDVTVYDHHGTQVESLSLGATTNSEGLAFHSKGRGKGAGTLYVSDAGNDDVQIFGPPPPGPPFVTSETETPQGTTGAILNASIVPAGHDTTCVFQYVDSATFDASGYTNATTVPCTPADLGSGFTFQQASATIGGLTIGTFYHFHAIATNSAGTTTGADVTFQAGPGDWTPFFRCPVDDPAMLATDGGVTTLALCIASNSTHGSFTIGSNTAITGNTNLQIGVILDETNGNSTVVAPQGGALVADPAQVSVSGITVTATVESAGVPSNFSLLGGIQTGIPIITLPIKIHLTGGTPDVGPACFIGTDADPIILMPQNTDLSMATTKFETFDANGQPDPNGPLQLIQVNGAVQGDDVFSVPGASGCGPNGDGSLDAAVDALAGLPSPSGNNHLVLDDASSSIAALADGENGQAFANDWHSVFGASPTTTTTTSTTTTTAPASPSRAFLQ